MVTETLEKKKYPYPRAIPFIITNEFCERFSYYGMRTILSLYLRDKLGYDDNNATIIYHVFTMFVYFFPVIGAMIADSWLGKFRTIIYLSIVYVCGNVLISLTAMPPINIPSVPFTMVALLLIAFGTGGIKPCVAAFGGDQFKLPQQEKYLVTFFSLFYFAINSGSLISTFITPILRQDVHCFGDKSCFSLAFGVPGILMFTSIVIFLLGKRLYVIKNPSGNIFLSVSKCIAHGVSRKIKSKEKRGHWLDHAEDKYDRALIDDVKALLRVLVLFIPLPVFWALFDQQGSRWTFQADRMDQQIGSFTLKADQMQVVNPLLILVFIPIFEVAIYPLMTWCRLIRKPLHKMIWGGLLAAAAFGVSGLVELQLVKTYPVALSAGHTHFRVYNGFPCNVTVNINSGNETFVVKSLSMYEDLYFENTDETNIPYSMSGEPNTECQSVNFEGQFNLTEKTANSFFIREGGVVSFIDSNDKSISATHNLRLLANIPTEQMVSFVDTSSGQTVLQVSSSSTSQNSIATGSYNVVVNDHIALSHLQIKAGAVYTVNLFGNSASVYAAGVHQITPANTIHILWLLPQYIIITMGEVMFSVTGLEFSFTQAPASMKSVLQSVWLLTVAFGNLIVTLVVKGNFLDAQWKEFFLFGGLMVVDMMIFSIMAFRYKYSSPTTDSEYETGDNISLPEKKSIDGINKTYCINKAME